MNKWMKALENIVWLTQLGLSIILPPILCMLFCAWLVNSCGAPQWLYILFLLLGIASGAQGFWSFYKMMMKKVGKNDDGPVHFNRHQ